MPGPLPVPPIQLPAWAKALCALVHGAPALAPPPPPEWGTGGSGPPGSEGNPLTQAQAVWLFRLMKEQEHIPFDYAREYCFARAHEMYRLMTGLGIEARKVWNLCNNTDSEGTPWDDDENIIPEGAIRIEHPTQGTILWVYHVAPTVSVMTPQGPVRMVIDPSLFQGPATEAQWRQEQADPHSIWEETSGELYGPESRDDDYSRTNRDLEFARNAHQAFLHGLVPPEPETPEEGLVPEESSEDEAQTA